MAKHVELYGVDLNEFPGGRIWSNERFLRWSANGLAGARVVGGPAVAGYILSHAPEDRSWKVGIGVALLGATDRLDGDMIRALKSSFDEGELEEYNECGHGNFGAWLDQFSDKAFVVPPMGALAVRGEISSAHPIAKLSRDVATSRAKKRIQELSGSFPSASELARYKTTAEMAAVAIGSSPLAALTGPDGETTFTEYAFRASTTLSLASGARYIGDLREAIINARVSDVEEIVIDQAEVV